MKIDFDELTIINAEKLYKSIIEVLENEFPEKLILDMSNVEKIDLCNIQLLLSLNKFCKNQNITFELTNITSKQINQTFCTYGLEETLKVS